jgi:hypothetical protein
MVDIGSGAQRRGSRASLFTGLTKPGREPKPRPEEPELDALRRHNAPLRAQVAALTRERDDARARATASVGAGAEAAVAKRDREIERLREALAKAEALPAADPGEVAELQRQLKAAKTWARTLTLAANRSRTKADAFR